MMEYNSLADRSWQETIHQPAEKSAMMYHRLKVRQDAIRPNNFIYQQEKCAVNTRPHKVLVLGVAALSADRVMQWGVCILTKGVHGV